MQKAKETLNLVSQCRRSPPAIMYNEDAGSGIVICTWSEICNSYTGAYSLSHRCRLRRPCKGCDQTSSSILRTLRTRSTRCLCPPLSTLVMSLACHFRHSFNCSELLYPLFYFRLPNQHYAPLYIASCCSSYSLDA